MVEAGIWQPRTRNGRLSIWECDPMIDHLNNRVHHDLSYTVPFMKGGTDHVAVSGSLHLYYRRVRFDELDRRRVYSAGTPF
jgi:hypothetical protein